MATTAHAPEYVTMNEAARRLGVNPRILRQASDAGEFEVYRIGQRWLRVSWDDVLGWLHRQRFSRERSREL